MVAGALPFVTASAVASVGAIAFAFGRPLPSTALALGLALAVAAVSLSARRAGWEGAAVARGVALSAVACAAAVPLALAFVDTSDDGQGYHLGAMIRMAQGWNPWRHLVSEADTPNWLWIDHYPRGGWTLGAAVLSATGRLELVKAMNLVLLSGSLFLAVAAARRAFPPRAALAVGALAALNPIAVAQLSSDYVDGQLASSTAAVVAATALVLTRGGPPAALALAAALTTAIGLKFTGAVYAVTLAVAGTLFAVAMGDRTGARRVAVTAALACTVAGLAVHWNPYVTNTLRHGHPFHPMQGPTRVYMTEGELAPAYENRNRAERLAISLFSRTDQPPRSTANPRLKVPFTLYPDEWPRIGLVDPRAGGFGPFFSGALLLAGLVLAVSGRAGLLAAFAAGSLLVSALANPHAWWARYVPQLWLVPVLAVCAGWTSRRRAARALATATAVALAVNVAAVGISSFSTQQKFTARARAQIARLAALPPPVEVAFDPLYAETLRARLMEAKIAFRELSWDACQEVEQLGFTRVCRAAAARR